MSKLGSVQSGYLLILQYFWWNLFCGWDRNPDSYRTLVGKQSSLWSPPDSLLLICFWWKFWFHHPRKTKQKLSIMKHNYMNINRNCFFSHMKVLKSSLLRWQIWRKSDTIQNSVLKFLWKNTILPTLYTTNYFVADFTNNLVLCVQYCVYCENNIVCNCEYNIVFFSSLKVHLQKFCVKCAPK